MPTAGATGRILSRTSNYLSIYYLLLRHYLRFDPHGALKTGLTVCVIAVLYPVPFYLLALAPSAALSGSSEIVLPLGLSLSLEISIALALGWFACVAGANCATDRWIIRRNRAWQDMLFCQIIERLPRMARVDRVSDLPLPTDINRLFRIVFQATRSAFLIGRLISIGLKDMVVALVTLSALSVLDSAGLLLILLVSAAFLPVYIAVATQMVETRRGLDRDARTSRRQATVLLEKAGRSWQSPESSMIDRNEAAGTYSFIYGLPNRQYAILASLNMIATLHAVSVAAALTVLLVWSGRGFGKDEAIYFVLLVLFLRALMSFVSLLARFTRAYDQMALLRNLIAPRRKRRMSPRPTRNALFIRTNGGSDELVISGGGPPVYLLQPSIRQSFDLIPVADALNPMSPAMTASGDWLALVHRADLRAIWSSSDGCKSAKLGVLNCEGAAANRASSFQSESIRGAVLVFTLGAWEEASKISWMSELIAARPVLIAVEPHRPPREWISDARMIVCDGKSILAIGDAAGLFDRFSDALAKRHAGQGADPITGDDNMV